MQIIIVQILYIYLKKKKKSNIPPTIRLVATWDNPEHYMIQQLPVLYHGMLHLGPVIYIFYLQRIIIIFMTTIKNQKENSSENILFASYNIIKTAFPIKP